MVGDRAKHDDDAFSPQWEDNFRIVGYTEVIQDGHRADQYPEVGLWSGDDLEQGRIKVSGEAFSVDAFLMFPCIVYVSWRFPASYPIFLTSLCLLSNRFQILKRLGFTPHLI